MEYNQDENDNMEIVMAPYMLPSTLQRKLGCGVQGMK